MNEILLEEGSCVICGGKTIKPSHNLCRTCSPNFYKKQSFPHQRIRRTKKWTENRESRLKLANGRCEICKSKIEEKYIIHHKALIGYNTYNFLWQRAILVKLKELLSKNVEWEESWKKSLKKIGEYIESCPHCWRSNFNKRKNITPKYKCANWGCLEPFDKPFIRGHRQSKNYYKVRSDFMKKVVSLYYLELKEAYKNQEKLLVEKYLSMEDTLVLCVKCHYKKKNWSRVYMKDYYFMDIDFC